MNEESVLDQKQVIEVVHVARSEQASVSITISLCRESNTKYKGRRQITISQFRKPQTSRFDSKSEVKKLSNSMFEQRAAEALHN